MVGSSKILTVSYGTFSCTLEGFDDSFSTMKAIAEYFRDLAADDRYFGAEPATPDADMLARIAEREIARRVEARTDGTGIVLRAGSALTEAVPAGDTDADLAGTEDAAISAPTEAEPAAAPGKIAPDRTAPSDDLTDASEQAAPATAPSETLAGVPKDAAPAASELLATAPASAPVAHSADAPGAQSSEAQDANAPEVYREAPAAEGKRQSRTSEAARNTAPLMPPAAVTPATATPRPAPVRIPQPPAAGPQPTPRVSERAPGPVHPDAESVAAKLQRIRAVVGRATPLAAASAPAAAPEAAAPPPAPKTLPTPEPVEDQTAEVQPTETAAQAVAAPAAQSTDAAPAAPSRIEARVIRMRRADFEAAVSTGTLIEDESDTAADPPQERSPVQTSLSAEDEEALQAELAALEDDLSDADAREDATPDDGPETATDYDLSEAADDEAVDDVEGVAFDDDEDIAYDDDEDVAGDELDAEDNEADLADRDEDIAQDNDRDFAATGGTDIDNAAAPAPDETAIDDTAEPEIQTPAASLLAENIRSALAASLTGSGAVDVAGDTTDSSDRDDAETEFDGDTEDAAGDGFYDVVDDVEDAAADGTVAIPMDDIESNGTNAHDHSDDAVQGGETGSARAHLNADDAGAIATSGDSDDTASGDDADPVDTAEAVAPLRPRRVRLPALPIEDEEDLLRISKQTDVAMDAPENRSRRDAIHQLKAAVAATEAARKLGETPVQAEEDDRHETAFRDDLEQVVRPRRPIRPGTAQARTERPRPAPLKLVASQRVDAPASGDGAVADAPVRPRRVALTEAPKAAAPGTVPFPDFAMDMGATGLNDLMEAAAAHTAFVEGHEDFSRPQLMSKLQETATSPISREDGLRAFGALLRQGRLTKVRNGRFAIPGDTRFNPKRRAG